MDSPSDLCVLTHPVFSRFGPALFQRDETDREAVMIVSLGDKTAVIPLRSLQREFSIEADSADGRMLDLISAALDFVSQIRVGDPLPTEILSGDASWAPEPVHVEIASARLRVALVTWLSGSAEAVHARAPGDLLALVEDPAFRARVQEAFARAAAELGMPSVAAVIEAIETFAKELAYVEALRARLLAPVQRLLRKISDIQSRWRGDTTHGETLTQVQRLTHRAVRQLTARFAEIDAQTGEIIAALRNDESQRGFIRANRDWLYRALRGWEPILALWADISEIKDRDLWALIERTYRFLAPRYMTVTEWTSQHQTGGRNKNHAQMVW